MDGREGMPQTSFRTIVVLTLLPVAGLIGFLLWYFFWPTGESLSTPVSRPAPAPAKPPAKEAATIVPQPKKPAGAIVLILDDFGFDGQPIERAMQLDPDINFAILPNGNRAAEFARRLNSRGFEILCHLPMEPVGTASPGVGAILTSMADEEIARLVRQNIRSIPYARGVNNHMGSRATADRRVMATVLGALPEGMYFVDSRTGGSSVAETVAREMNVRTAARHVFLDDVRTASAVRQQLAAATSIARERGLAVAIGHPHPVTLDVLAEEIPRLRESGFRFVRASSAVN